MENSYYNIVETLLLIYAADEGKLKIYLKKKQEEPYKGYWTLPSAPLDNVTTLEENVNIIYKNMTGLEESTVFESKSFSNLDRDPSGRIIGMSFIAVTDKGLTDMKQSTSDKEWFEVDELPKLGFDHASIINTVTEDVKKKIISNYDDMLLAFFPSDFTLPELQKVYESILEKKLDRRNFRKKILNMDMIIPTDEEKIFAGKKKAKIYKFKEKEE